MNEILAVCAMSFGALILFLIFRHVILWYWRLNDIADSLGKIVVELKRVNPNYKECPNCDRFNFKDAKACGNCKHEFSN